jgi:6-pyruvoyltetrahydropterin/6-carboxytetrahydropterin synthase
MAIVYLTRVEKFNAAHKLWISEWTEEENFAYFGKCANKNWHGHNYTLYVTVKGTPDPLIGFVHDAKKLSKIIREVITDKLDHSNLNLDTDFLPAGMMPTTENMTLLDLAATRTTYQRLYLALCKTAGNGYNLCRVLW